MDFFKKYVCEKCGKKFRHIEQLMQHEQVIHEALLYECKKCNLSFTGMEQMRDHARKYHSYNKMKEGK